MQDGADKNTPLAARVVLGKKEAITSAIFVVILLNMGVLVLVRAAMLLIPSDIYALFWVILALLLAADIALSPLCFHYAIKEVNENNAAPSYTITMDDDGMLTLYHRDGRTQTLNSAEVISIKHHVAQFDWNSFAGGSKRGYGTIRFVVQSQMGRIIRYKVKYVVNCRYAADFLRSVIFKKDDGATDNNGAINNDNTKKQSGE